MYDATKRWRRFLEQWKENSPWVIYFDSDVKMYCTVCKKCPSICEKHGALVAVFCWNQTYQGHNSTCSTLNCTWKESFNLNKYLFYFTQKINILDILGLVVLIVGLGFNYWASGNQKPSSPGIVAFEKCVTLCIVPLVWLNLEGFTTAAKHLQNERHI